jgi:hypothetical protein
LSPGALFPILFSPPTCQIREKDEWYKEDGLKGMLRMKLRAECIRLHIQGRKIGKVLLPLV